MSPFSRQKTFFGINGIKKMIGSYSILLDEVLILSADIFLSVCFFEMKKLKEKIARKALVQRRGIFRGI